MKLPDLPPRTIAVGWATVELDRAARELSALLEAGSRFVDGPPSATLGARTRLGRAGVVSGSALWLAILEPDTEGRLAATLARQGEGWAATWVPATVADPAAGGRLAAARPGPFGSERLILGGPPGGLLRLVVEAATIGS